MQWLDNIASKTAALKQAAGVHLSIGRDGNLQLWYVVLKRKKQQLILEEKGTLSWEDFLQQHAKAIPVSLSVDGKGVLTKVFAGGEDSALKEVLPGSSEADFYYNTSSGTTCSWISLCRRSILEKILQNAKAAGLSVGQVQLGPLSVLNILPLLQGSSEIVLPQWQLEQQQGQLVTLKQHTVEAEFSYKIGDEQLTGAYLQAYANALSKLVNFDVYESSNLKHLALQWLHQRLHKRMGIGLLVFFFAILLLNFSLFSYLSSSQQALSTRLQQQQHLLGQLQELRKQEEARNQLLKALPMDSQTLFAYHADLLGASVPEGIHLEEVLLNPQEGRKSKQQALHFQHGLMEVKGQCSNPVLLNRWLEKLEKESWVRAVKNQRYSSSTQEREASSFGFTIHIAAP